MPFVEGGIVVDAEPQQQAAPTMAQGGFVQGGIEVDPTPEDSYNKVLQFQAAQTDYTPSKQEYLDYLKVSKTKPLLGETPLQTIGVAAAQTAKDILAMPYRLGEAIGEVYQPPEGATEGDVALGTAAEIAMQSRLKAESMARGAYDVALSNLEKLTGKLRSDDDRYEAFLATSEIKRQLARANAPEEQRVPAAQEFLQAYNIPQEAISQPGLEVGGFAADPSSIAFAAGGRAIGALAQRAAPLIPRVGAAFQRGGEAVSRFGGLPERGAAALTSAVTGSPAMGQAVQEAIAKGTTGVALGEAAGLPITAQLNVPGLGTASRIIGGTKAAGATMETLGEAGAISGGQTLTPIQRGLLGAGERIAAAEGASASARAFGTALARSGLEAPIKTAASILIPAAGAAAGGGLLAGLTGEEGEAVAAAVGSGLAFGGIDAGFRLAKAASSDALNGNRVRRTAVEDLNTRPTEVQFTYIDPNTGAEQLSTIKDSEARAKLYAGLNNKQLTKALSEVAGAEAGGAEVIFHSAGDPVPASLQGVDYAGVAIGPNNIKSGKPTILINVDRAKPETLPHEILHARITGDVVSRLGSQVIETSAQSPEFQRQFTDFANRYADKLQASGAPVVADRIRTELRDAFDPTQQRAQRIESLKRMTDEFAAYYTQELLKGKDPKTLLPGRIPSFFEMAFNNAKEAVSERFTRQALQNGFDPVARTFYDAKGRRIKIDWMEDAIKNLINPKEGFEPTEQKVDTRRMTQAQQNALILARGYSDLFMTGPDGSIIRPLSRAELAAKTADVANRTMRVIETVPQNERTSISGMDAKGNPIIEGRLSLVEADAVSKSGIFSPSTSRYIVDIATAIRDGTLMEGRYWKVYGPTGKSGVFGESEKLFLPYGISINSKGGVNVKAVDWGKVQARMYKALTKPAYKNLFGNYDQAMSTLKDVYLKNIAEQNAAPSAEALGGGLEGAKKRNFFNEVMGAVPKKGDVMINLPTAGYEAGRKGGSVYQDLRIERIQNANLTGNNIPWSGDMGEQSSYRRTQLNFQPAENIGETQVSTDQNGGYRILSKNGKFRLYGPDGSTAGIFDTEGQAKLKAEKDYATQARLQPEVRQQQRPLRDEVRQAAEAGGRNRDVSRTQGREEGGQELGAVRQAGDVVIAPDAESFTIPKADIGRFMPASDKVNLEDYADRKIIALAADRMGIGQMSVGPKGEKRNLSVLGQGGRGFMNIFNGGGWAFSDFKTADKFLKRLRAEADPDGNVIVGITVQSPINHLKNQTGQLAYIEAMQAAIDSKTITKRAADAQVAAMSSSIVQSTAKSIKPPTKEKFSEIKSFKDLKKAVADKRLNFADMEPMLTQMQRKALPITNKELSDIGMTAADIARDIADPELADVPFGSVVALLGVNVSQAPERTGFHYSYPWTIHGDAIGYLNKFYNISDLSTEKRIRNTAGQVTAQPLQTVLPVMDNIVNTIKTKQGIPSDPSMRFMPSSLTARDINAIASEVGGGDVKGGAKAFGAFMRSMRDKGITLRDVVKSYGITLSSIQRQELPVSTIKKNWPDAPFQEGTKVRPEDAFAQLLGTPEGQKYLDAAESGVFDEQAADAVVQKFRSFGFHNKLKEQMKTAVEQFYPKAQEIINAVNTMPTDQFIDYVRNNFKGISYGKVGFWSGQLGRGDIPTFDSRQGKLVYGKEVPVTKQVLMEQKDRLTQLGIKVPAAFKDFAQTLLHHEVWDRLNQSDTEHGPIKEAMLRFMPSDTDYLSAVQQGDTQAAQRMVDEAAKAAGYTIGPVYHGTPTGGFNVFDKRMRGETSGVSRQAFSFTTDKKAAEGYSKRLGDEAVRLDAGLRVANDAMRRFDDDVAAQEYFSSKGYTSVEDGMLPEFDWGSIDDVPEFIKELRGHAKDLKPINPDLASSFVEAAKVMTSTKAVPEVKRVFLRIPDNAPVFQATPATLGMVMRDFSAEREPTKSGIVELPGNERIYYVADSSQVKLADPVTKDAQGNVIPLSKRFQASSEDIRFMPDYSGEHRAPRRDSGSSLDNLKGVYPDDVYGPNAARYYGHESGSQTDKAAVRIIQATKGKPDAPVKVFRAIPKSIQSNEINPGDWITTIKSYAVQHGEGPLGGDYKILEKTVPAGDLYTDGNSIFEFGYDPKFMPQPDSAMPGAYSFQGGYRAIPGKTKGSLRLYGPAGSLIGIASSLDEAQRILRRKAKQ